MNIGEANAVLVVLRRAGLLDEERDRARDELSDAGLYDEQFRRAVQLLAERAGRALLLRVRTVEDPAVVVPFRVPPGAPVVLPEQDEAPEEGSEAA